MFQHNGSSAADFNSGDIRMKPQLDGPHELAIDERRMPCHPDATKSQCSAPAFAPLRSGEPEAGAEDTSVKSVATLA